MKFDTFKSMVLASSLAFQFFVFNNVLAQFYNQQYAVVIGIDKYSHKNWPGLTYARKDAEGVANMMRQLGFTVYLLYDYEASKSHIMALLEDRIAPILKEDDAVFVFFAGHGTTRSLGGEEWGYIVPCDGTSNYSSLISMTELETLSRKMGSARHQAFIMDCRYGGQFARRNVKIPETVPNYLREISQRRARQILTAGGKDQQVADGGPFGHSLFTGYFIKAIREGLADIDQNGWITFNELVTYIQPNASSAIQTPGFSTLPGHELGEFLFKSLSGKTVVYKNKSEQHNTSETVNGFEPTVENKQKLLRNSSFQIEVVKARAESPVEIPINTLSLILEESIKKNGGRVVKQGEIGDIFMEVSVSLFSSSKLGRNKYKTAIDFEYELYSNIENRLIDSHVHSISGFGESETKSQVDVLEQVVEKTVRSKKLSRFLHSF